MGKTATFNDSAEDKELIKRIEKYKKDKKLDSFIAAIRQLCDIALKFDEIKRK